MAESVKQNYEWLIIFLVYNNNYYDVKNQDTKDYYTMKEQTKYILNQIRYSSYNWKVKTIFVEAQIKNEKISEEENKAVATLSMLYKKRGTWLSAVDKIWRDGTPIEVLTDAKSLEDVLKRLRDKYPAKKHMIITAGHGSIVGINYYIPGLLPKAKDNAELRENLEKIVVPEGERDPKELVSEPVLNNDTLLYLANKEISEVLKSVFSDKKVDVLIMYNCIMQNIFTQFELRETVDWLVAPISGISIPGFNYRSVLDEINIHPSIDGEMVAQLLINSIRAGNRYSYFKEDIEGTWKVLALQLDKNKYELIQDRFHNLLKAIDNSCTQYGRVPISCIKETLRFIFNYSQYCLSSIHIIDLGVFLEYFKENIKSNYKNLSDLLPPVISLQETIKQSSKQYLFEGTNFYKNGVAHKEDEPQYKQSIANIALLLPFRKMHSKLLEGMLDPNNYGTSINREYVPGFLKDAGYGQLVNKIINRF